MTPTSYSRIQAPCASEGDRLSDFSAVCGNCLRPGARIVTTDKRLLSVDGLWEFELLDELEGPNRETGGTSVAYVQQVVRSRREAAVKCLSNQE